MDIKHKDNGNEGSFYIEQDGKETAQLTYRHDGDHLVIIDHTEVSDALKGQGVGKKLIESAVGYLRQNNLKAVAECPFVKSVFEKKHDTYHDVIK